MNLEQTYFDSHYFQQSIRNAINDILFKAVDPQILSDVLCSQLYYSLIYKITENIKRIEQELMPYSSSSEIGRRFESQNTEINMLKNKINLLEQELKEIKDLLESRLEFS